MTGCHLFAPISCCSNAGVRWSPECPLLSGFGIHYFAVTQYSRFFFQRGSTSCFQLHPNRVHWVTQTIREVLNSWGYWAVLAGLLGENAGVPIPGETVLMFASFLAHKDEKLRIYWIVICGIGAATLGDNLGFFLGRHFSRTFIKILKKIFRLDDLDIGAARDLLKRHGGRTIFVSRFIFGLRTIAGPLAGTLDMDWPRFFKFNALGATTWVLIMAFIGYAFANQFESLLGYIEKGSWAIDGAIFAVGYWIWRKQRRSYKQRHNNKAA